MLNYSFETTAKQLKFGFQHRNYLQMLFWPAALVGPFKSSLSWSFTHSLGWRTGINSYLHWDVVCLLGWTQHGLVWAPSAATSPGYMEHIPKQTSMADTAYRFL